MSYWTWDSSYNVGIDIIDEQHHRIVTYMNDLNDACLEKDKSKVTEILNDLMDYVVTHFIFEEDLMERVGYPLSETHKEEHQSFITRINNYSEEHKKGHDVAKKLMSELRLWFTNHIKYEDRNYVPYTNAFLQEKKSWLDATLARLFSK